MGNVILKMLYLVTYACYPFEIWKSYSIKIQVARDNSLKFLIMKFIYEGHLGHCEYIACFSSPSSAQTDAGGRWFLTISYTFDYLTALLELEILNHF